ncbi:hypothetical protein K501DRAFT_308601 [Backusella circina FSU 941]|nr:hypothetical protein K501DRAFT_308601 [Backusella circina FSU 941]
MNEQCEYEYLDGRPYITSHHPGFFVLPCDADESDRMVILHFFIKFAFNGNFVSPIVQSLRMTQRINVKADRPKVLDIGCGAGTWILEMGSEYPSADFHGIDIRTMFPSTIKPPNTHFTKYNFFKNLPYQDNTFVFIRMQLVLLFATQSELLHLLSEIYRTLKPGGYFELLDCEYQIHRPGPLSDNLINHTCKFYCSNGIYEYICIFNICISSPSL